MDTTVLITMELASIHWYAFASSKPKWTVRRVMRELTHITLTLLGLPKAYMLAVADEHKTYIGPKALMHASHKEEIFGPNFTRALLPAKVRAKNSPQ